jgi:serine/threonine protein kinase
LERLYAGVTAGEDPRPVLVRRLLPGTPPEERVETAGVFQHHMSRLARLTDIGTLPVREYTSTSDGPFVFVTDVPTGVTLRELVDAAGPLPVATTAAIGVALGERLVHAHGVGVIHGALHGDNVLLNQDGTLTILEMGLVPMLVERLAGRLQRFPTAWNSIFPEAGAVSPDVLRGETLGPWTDVYGMGVLLYRMLTGTAPYEGTAVLAQNTILTGSNPVRVHHELPDVDVRAAALVDACLARDIATRPASVAEVVAGLQDIARPWSEVTSTLRASLSNQSYCDRFESLLRVVNSDEAMPHESEASVAYLFADSDEPLSEATLIQQMTPEQRRLFMHLTSHKAAGSIGGSNSMGVQIKRGAVLGVIVAVVLILILWPGWMDSLVGGNEAESSSATPAESPNEDVVIPQHGPEAHDERRWRRPLEILVQPSSESSEE